MNYSLNINISPADLSNILANGYSVIVYNITDNGTPVVWVAFSPMSNNQVQWDNNYMVYASTTTIMQGAQVMMMANTQASPQHQYTFGAGSFSEAPMAGLGSTQYGLAYTGAMGPAMTMGLAKQANVNGMQAPAAPVNALNITGNGATSVTGYQNKVYVALGRYNAGTIASLPAIGCYGNFDTTTQLTMNYEGGNFVVV